MAETLKSPKPPKVKKLKAANGAAKADASPGPGHNLTELRKKAEPIFKRLAALTEEKAEEQAKFTADFKELYEEGAQEIGIPAPLLRQMWGDVERETKRAKRIAKLKGYEREQMKAVAAALENTPFGQYLRGKIDAPQPAA